MKAIISRYYEETRNPYFSQRKCASIFWGKGHPPHWAICRPDYRTKLCKDDIVLFVRRQDEDKPGKASFCTAVLEVGDVLTESQAAEWFGKKWYVAFKKEARKPSHQSYRTKGWRDHIILGKRAKSFWLGPNGQDLKGLIRARYGIQRIPPYTNEKRLRNVVSILRQGKRAKGSKSFDKNIECEQDRSPCGNCRGRRN